MINGTAVKEAPREDNMKNSTKNLFSNVDSKVKLEKMKCNEANVNNAESQKFSIKQNKNKCDLNQSDHNIKLDLKFIPGLPKDPVVWDQNSPQTSKINHNNFINLKKIQKCGEKPINNNAKCIKQQYSLLGIVQKKK